MVNCERRDLISPLIFSSGKADRAAKQRFGIVGIVRYRQDTVLPNIRQSDGGVVRATPRPVWGFNPIKWEVVLSFFGIQMYRVLRGRYRYRPQVPI